MRVLRLIALIMIAGILFGSNDIIRVSMQGVYVRGHNWRSPLTKIEARGPDRGFVYLVGSTRANNDTDTFSFFKSKWKYVKLKTFVCHDNDTIKGFYAVQSQDSPYVYLLVTTARNDTDTIISTKWDKIKFFTQEITADSGVYGFEVHYQDSDVVLSVISPTGIEEQTPVIGSQFKILSVYPQPSHGSVYLRFIIPKPGKTEFVIYDVSGRVLRRWTRNLKQGIQTEFINKRIFRYSGIYFIQTEYLGEKNINKIVILK